MRSVSTAKRLRFLSWIVLLYGLATIVGGAIAGVLLYRYVRDVPYKIVDDQYVPPTTTRPYEWQGIAVVIAAVVVGTFVVVLAELIRLKANLVIEDRAAAAEPAHRAAPQHVATNGAVTNSPPPVAPTPPPTAALRTRSRGRGRTGDRVVVLTEGQVERLAALPPPSLTEGWYPDPLGESDLRRWNGVQWTGQQCTITLPNV